MTQVDQLMFEAINHVTHGRHDLSTETCAKILQQEPEHLATLDLLFVIARDEEGQLVNILKLMRQVIEDRADSAPLHFNLAMMLRVSGQLEDAVESYKDALELRPDFSEARIQLEELLQEMDMLAPPPPDTPCLSLGPGLEFKKLELHTTGKVLMGVCQKGKYFTKIELIHHPNKSNSLKQEANIMAHLNKRGCVSCPTVIIYGKIGAEDLEPFLDEEQKKIIRSISDNDFDFIVEEYVPSATNLNLADMVLSLIEQKNLGVYQGDLKPANLRVDPASGICYFIDYDQAEFLDEKVMNLDNISFFNWCNERAKEKYNFQSFLQYFHKYGIDFENDFMKYFRNGSFNLGETTIFSRQQTTLAKCGVYHTLREESIYSDGERDIDDRRPLLDDIVFAAGERVLDVGCNAGLISTYLHDRGCCVTGIDLDQSIIYGARVVANILGKDIRYECLDLDKDDIAGEFDTVILFSVLHHTRNVARNAERIAEKSRRILIECRLKEGGAKPEEGVWQATSNWKFDSVEDLIAMLEGLFPGFELVKNHGQGDRNRYLLEFAKG